MTQAEWMMLLALCRRSPAAWFKRLWLPMMSTAVLSSAYPLSIAVTLVILPCLLLNLIMLNADPAHSLLNSIGYYIKRYWPLMLSSLVGSVLGVKLLLWLNEAYLKLLLGLVIIFYVLDQLRARPLQVSPHISSMLCFGLLAGIIGGATNAMAPFLMMYLMSCQLSKTDIVIISNLNFIAGKLIQLVLLFPILITLETHQQHILIGISLFALAGVWIGGKYAIVYLSSTSNGLSWLYFWVWACMLSGKVLDYCNNLVIVSLNRIFFKQIKITNSKLAYKNDVNKHLARRAYDSDQPSYPDQCYAQRTAERLDPYSCRSHRSLWLISLPAL